MKRPITPDRRWVFLLEREPFVVALTGAGDNSSGEWVTEYIDALRGFERYRGKQSSCHVTAPIDLTDWVEYPIHIQCGAQRLTSHIGLADRIEDRVGERSVEISAACPVTGGRVRCAVKTLLPVALALGRRAEFPRYAVSQLQIGKRFYQSEIHFEHQEVSMAIQSDALRDEMSPVVGATLELGSIELLLEDALGLRPGTRLVLPIPKQFKAALRIDDVRWASVLVEVGEEKVSLTVSDVAVREATFSGIPREER